MRCVACNEDKNINELRIHQGAVICIECLINHFIVELKQLKAEIELALRRLERYADR
jgi:recombinational DNA repair protein (RecF pathway)